MRAVDGEVEGRELVEKELSGEGGEGAFEDLQVAEQGRRFKPLVPYYTLPPLP